MLNNGDIVVKIDRIHFLNTGEFKSLDDDFTVFLIEGLESPVEEGWQWRLPVSLAVVK